MSVKFTATALRNLGSIRSYIGERSPLAASRVSVAIMAACDRLEHLPERGRPGLRPGTREVTTVWPYVIVYRIIGDGVEILRIWHGAQER